MLGQIKIFHVGSHQFREPLRAQASCPLQMGWAVRCSGGNTSQQQLMTSTWHSAVWSIGCLDLLSCIFAAVLAAFIAAQYSQHWIVSPWGRWDETKDGHSIREAIAATRTCLQAARWGGGRRWIASKASRRRIVNMVHWHVKQKDQSMQTSADQEPGSTGEPSLTAAALEE